MPPPGFGRAFFAAPGIAERFFAGAPSSTESCSGSLGGGPLSCEPGFESTLPPPFGPTSQPTLESLTFAAGSSLGTTRGTTFNDHTSSAETSSSAASSSGSCVGSSSSAITASSDVFTISRTTELELLHHYQSEGHKSLVHTYNPEAEADSLFRDDIPRLAFSHNFLLDAILSLSAFHLADLKRSVDKGAHDWVTIGLHYHQRSVRSLRLAILNNTKEELQKQYTGLLFGATFIGIASFVSMQQPRRTSFVESIRGLAGMMQGTASIHGLDSGGFEALRGRGKVDGNPADYVLDQDVEDALHELRVRAVQQDAIIQGQAWDGSPPSSGTGTSYADTVSRLRECFVACDRGNELEGGTAWPALRMPGFGSRLELQDPVSYLVVLTLGVLWSHLQERWWGRDIGRCAVEELTSMEVLKDQQYQSLVLWARRRVGLAV